MPVVVSIKQCKYIFDWNKGAFTYYVITGGGGGCECLRMITGGGGQGLDYVIKIFSATEKNARVWIEWGITIWYGNQGGTRILDMI